ncbi:hypothetical protein, partial [Ornithobacterium rhinotracheale]
KNSQNISLDINRGLTKINDRLYQKGQKALFSTGYIGRAYDNAIKHNITKTHEFIFNQAGRRVFVYLPSANEIKQAFGLCYGENVNFELKILVINPTKGTVRIEGS